MIASWIMKRMDPPVRSVFDKLSQGDAEAGFAGFADDGVYDFPLELSVGGTLKGKKAIIEWYRKWYEQFPKRKLVAKNIAFAAYPLSPTNVIMTEWTCEETDKEGKVFKYDGVAVTEARVYALSGERPLYTVGFLNVNRSHITVVMPQTKIENKLWGV